MEVNVEADTILAHGIVVTMDSAFRVMPDGALAMKDGRILAVGSSQQVLAEWASSDVVDCAG